MSGPAAATLGTCLINARLPGGEVGTLTMVGPRIVALNDRPRPEESIIDLEGDRVLPGLINAHDHLQLNNIPSVESGKRYVHVRHWMADINARRLNDPQFEACVKVGRRTRLLIGGMKNLLSGVTTVAHHDPFYSDLLDRDYPVGIVAHSGWSHSLYLDGPQKVRETYLKTPAEWPWIIHAAEGVDEEATDEFDRLDEMQCIGANTLLVHGIALDVARLRRLEATSAGLIWCPASNLNLFGRTLEIRRLLEHGRVALGTDSRLSGSRDLLDELHVAAEIAGLDETRLEKLVTLDSARLLRLADRGSLRPGLRADILILPADATLSNVARADVRLVIRGGMPAYADRAYAEFLVPREDWIDIRVDGRAKLLDRRIARLLLDADVKEPGITMTESTLQAA